jgi:hypothetical protein
MNRKRDFLAIPDFSTEELYDLLDYAGYDTFDSTIFNFSVPD